jgi:cell division protease FtsH
MANEQNEPEKNDGNGPKQKNRKILIIVLICALAAVLAYGLLSRGDSASEEIPYSRFTQMVADDQVTEIELRGSKMTVTAKEDEGEKKTYTVTLVGDENSLKELLQGHAVKYSKKTPGIGEDLLSMLISVVLPMAVLIGVFLYLMRGRGGIFGVGKSRAKAYVQKETGVTFADVAGEDEAKESLQEVVEFLHSPEQFKKIGAVLPKGALLVGPPGTGKTLLAKAVAGEAGVPFFSLSGSEFVELFVGVGASRVRDLFDEAKRNAPCIIFIDEIDAIGKVRDSAGNGGNDEREQTLNQLLAEMDGFDSASGLLILAATNRPEILDPALLRPGRFDRRIIVDTPDLKGRVEILKVHAKDVLLDDTVDFNEVALATSGAVGSDLANMINEAAILAVRRGRAAVSQSDLMEAVEVVLVGKEKKNKILSEKERKIVSYHEVGHALVSALEKDSEPVQKITIIPRTMGALGYVMQMPEEEKYLNTKKELETMVVGLLAGRAAEETVFDTVTTGASNDIERATSICRAMVTQYGMSERFGLIGLERTEDRYLTGRVVSECGDATATEVDHEVMEMLRKAYGRAKEILTANRDALDAIAGYLIQEETITGKEFMQLLHQVQDARAREGGECAAEDDGSAAEGDACTVKGENAG